jgi:hypothetical protein
VIEDSSGSRISKKTRGNSKDGETVITFKTIVHQNVYLPRGATVVHAILAVSALEVDSPNAAEGSGSVDAVEVFMLDSSGSMATPSSKMEAACSATCKGIDKLRDGTWFAIVSGTSFARLVYPAPSSRGDSGCTPSLARVSRITRTAAKEAVNKLKPNGGTAISSWLTLARQLFEASPSAIRHAILLADGKNENESGAHLAAELERCRGRFQCDCIGVGMDWDRAELQSVSDALLGSTDIIPGTAQTDDVFEAIVAKAMCKRQGSVALQVLTPLGGAVNFIRQVSPEVLSLTGAQTWQQPYGRSAEWRTVQEVDPERPLLSTYPIGAWAGGEVREYHVCLSVAPQNVGRENEVRAAQVSLLIDGTPASHASIRALWTDDVEQSSPIDRAVVHYTGQAELARSIQKGLDARRAGDDFAALSQLGHAAHLAYVTGNGPTTRLLQRVVEIEDAQRGTVRLRANVSKEDEMTLDTRSRRTVRLQKGAAP